MTSRQKSKAGGPPSSKQNPSFDTLIREYSFQHPSTENSEYPALQAAVQPHIESVNAITNDGLLDSGLKDIGRKVVFDHKSDVNDGRGNKLTFWFEEAQLSRPALSSRERTSLNRRVYPAECRERKITYRGSLRARFVYQLNDGPEQSEVRELGEIPILVKVSQYEDFDLLIVVESMSS